MAAAPRSSDARVVTSMLRWGFGAGMLAAILVGVVALLVWGSSSLASVAAASVITMVFFVVGVLGVSFVVGGAAGLSLAGAFVVYLGQLILLVFVFALLARTDWVHGRSFTLAAIHQALAWQAGLYLGFRRSRIPVLEGVDR